MTMLKDDKSDHVLPHLVEVLPGQVAGNCGVVCCVQYLRMQGDAAHIKVRLQVTLPSLPSTSRSSLQHPTLTVESGMSGNTCSYLQTGTGLEPPRLCLVGVLVHLEMIQQCLLYTIIFIQRKR